ncbi:MAG: hypothetical protein COV46_05020 [Deltaproteobacteria bacterium CG11_big_fil_rev_8_21_14_0_20_49_13]|nr:MAG: hypothetical protein COV46_05020 [Deltaproteobacteria bacterium CG11_big_fil_rev_8_21_14_0_20_49_13]
MLPGIETKTYQVGEMARKLGISQRTVRYYEELGLITAERSQNGYRVFSEAQAEKLKMVLVFKDIGMPLEEISRLIHLRQHGTTGSETAPNMLKYLNLKAEELKETVKKYNRLIKELEEVIKLVENCKVCNNMTEESSCERCVDSRTRHHVPPLLKTLL